MQATAKTVAAWIGVSTRRVKELRAGGVLPGDAGDSYDLQACVRAYCAHMRPETGRAAAGGSAGASTVDLARVKLFTEQTAQIAMRNAIARSEVLLVSDVIRAVNQCYRMVRDRLLSMPSTYAAQLHRCKTVIETQALLDRIVYDVLTDLGEASPYGTGRDTKSGSRGRAARQNAGPNHTGVPEPRSLE